MDEVVICVECEAMQNLGAGLNKEEDKKEDLSHSALSQPEEN